MPQPSSTTDPPTARYFADSQTDAALPVAWMLRRLRTTMWLAGLLIGVQTLSALPSGRTSHQALTQNDSASRVSPPHEADTQETVTLTQMSGSFDREIAAATGTATKTSRAVLPTGWRRTADGWQHVSDWSAATRRIPLSQRVVSQRNAQPVWLRNAMDSIRQTPPSSFALAQLASVGLLFWLVNRKKISPVDQTCLTLSQ